MKTTQIEILPPEQPNISDEIINRSLHLADMSIALTDGILSNDINTGKADAANRAITNGVASLALAWRGSRIAPKACEAIELKGVDDAN